LLAAFTAGYQALSVAAGYQGYIALEKEMVAAETELKVAAGSRNIAGVRIPAFEMMETGKKGRGYSLVDTSSSVDQAVEAFTRCLQALVEVAELQRSLELMGMEINRTKRIVNALEYMVIPALETTIKFLYMKFEERDREEKSRLKRVKVLLQRG